MKVHPPWRRGEAKDECTNGHARWRARLQGSMDGDGVASRSWDFGGRFFARFPYPAAVDRRQRRLGRWLVGGGGHMCPCVTTLCGAVRSHRRARGVDKDVRTHCRWLVRLCAKAHGGGFTERASTVKRRDAAWALYTT